MKFQNLINCCKYASLYFKWTARYTFLVLETVSYQNLLWYAQSPSKIVLSPKCFKESPENDCCNWTQKKLISALPFIGNHTLDNIFSLLQIATEETGPATQVSGGLHHTTHHSWKKQWFTNEIDVNVFLLQSLCTLLCVLSDAYLETKVFVFNWFLLLQVHLFFALCLYF